MGRTTIATLRDRVERLNQRLGTELTLESWSDGRQSRYRLDRPDGSHLNPRAGTAKQMDHFIDGLFALTNNRDILDRYTSQVEHTLQVDDYTIDTTEPTPSAEANTVRVVELMWKRADDFLIEETGKTVAEHNPFFPPDDPVVAGVYPHMNGDKTFHFPETRLRRA